jgi:GxxExxY protein
MNAEIGKQELNGVTSRIIGCAYRVSNTLGAGFPERVYEKALAIELRSADLEFRQQPVYQVRYREQVIGEFVPDLVVGNW